MPITRDQLIKELTSAGLVSSDEVTKFEEEKTPSGIDEILSHFVDVGKITRYQAERFGTGNGSEIAFGDYVVMDELGRGGMGTVLLARHRRMERSVAIKVLPISTLDSEPAIARFYQEVKVAAQLTHPNIVHAYDAGEHRGFHYLVMEHVRGKDLSKVLADDGVIPVEKAIKYVIQAATGLQYAHKKGVIHRDIKPSNLLLDDDGTIKILDMGLARIGSSGLNENTQSMHLTTTGQVMGTVEYMAPEQAEDTRAADQRSDIYSLGCTMYRFLTGNPPFSRDTVVKTILAHREAPIPSIAHGNPTLAKLDSIFRKMVEKRPETRYQDCGRLIDDLKQACDSASQSREELTIQTTNSSTRIAPPIVAPPSSSIASRQLPNSGSGSAHASGIQGVGSHASPSGAGAFDSADEYIEDLVIEDPSSIAQKPTPSGSSLSTGSINTTGAPSTDSLDNVSLRPHRGQGLFVLGIVSVLLSCCFIGGASGALTWVVANMDLNAMAKGEMDPNGSSKTSSARILGIVSVVFASLSLLGSIVNSMMGS